MGVPKLAPLPLRCGARVLGNEKGGRRQRRALVIGGSSAADSSETTILGTHITLIKVHA